ncbi:hypothetical protein SAMN05428987_4919 [Paenibacillus sp. CF095]|uniref:hypothetical protein n=1 Tax=Paenibacillus sp. CF095 TaxID=1881033 RepID=UPI00088732C5|nr:hypothetical protein [Paenibacillus sp. CF095]SDD48304.1 hypothetical protein SAMN05428987_4919 [Paenibacillus sp. CF095]
MKEPERYLNKSPNVFKVVGLSFRPEKRETATENKLSIGFKIGDWNEPINFIPYFQTVDRTQLH